MVNIEPEPGYDLNIISLKQKFNKQIKAELVRPAQGQRNWQVKVSCHSDQSADLYDFITLRTDNPDKPVIKIRVYAIYDQAGGAKKSGS